MEREMTCIQCPRGCRLTVNEETLEVRGNMCPRGREYGISEVTNPVRTVTSTCRVTGGRIPMVPCKTDTPVPKGKIFDVMDEINKTTVNAPVEIGQVLIGNVAGTGSNIVATRSVSGQEE